MPQKSAKPKLSQMWMKTNFKGTIDFMVQLHNLTLPVPSTLLCATLLEIFRVLFGSLFIPVSLFSRRSSSVSLKNSIYSGVDGKQTYIS
jgi:hypothetical protein